MPELQQRRNETVHMELVYNWTVNNNNSLQTTASIWHENMLGYLSRILSVPRSEEFSESFEKQIMSKDKYPGIFSLQMEAYCVYYPPNLFRKTRSFENWGIYKQ